jgi:dCMP deaminase
LLKGKSINLDLPFSFLTLGGVMMSRPNWDEYFMSIVDATALRASCDRGKSAAVITKDNRILSAGYVGNPSGTEHCDNVGHSFKYITEENENRTTTFHEGRHCVSTVHAEANAICNAARNGVAVKGATIYCTMMPCYNCAKLIIQSGIIRVVAKFSYHHSKDSLMLFRELNIDIIQLNEESSYEA